MNMENIQFNGSAISPVECVSQGWEIVKTNYLIFFAIGVAVVILGCIPVVSWLLLGPIMVGIYSALLIQYRGGKAEFGELFSGFSKFFPAFIIGFLFLLPGILLNSYNLILRLVQLFAIFNPNELTAGAATIFWIVGIVINLSAMIGSLLFGITFAFALPLLADKDLSLMDTIKLSAKAGWSNFGGLFLLSLLILLMIFGGILVFCIGVLFVLPVAYAAFIVAYRQVFPDGNSGQQNVPPAPQNYGNMYGQSR